MRKTLIALTTVLAIAPAVALAETNVIEGAEAEKLYAEKKGTNYVLAQQDKLFFLRSPDGSEKKKTQKVNC